MRNKILTALLCLAVSVGMWMYVVTVVSPEGEFSYGDIPVVLQSEGLLQDQGLIVTEVLTPTVSLRLSGPRSDLNKLSNTNILITADVSKISSVGEQQVGFSISYPGDVSAGSINVEQKKPGYVGVRVENLVPKEIPIQVSVVGEVEEGYVPVMESKHLSVDKLEILGPESVIEQIAYARVDVDLSDRSASFREEFAFVFCDEADNPVDKKLVTSEPETATFGLDILQEKELPLTVKVIDGGGATAKTCKISLEPKALWVSGTEEKLAQLEFLEVGTVDLATVLEDTEQEFTVTLPEGINLMYDNQKVTANISFPELHTKTLNITKFIVDNVPAGMKAEILTKSLEIRVRGPKAKISELDESKVKVTVDFSQAQEGAAPIKVTVTFEDTFKDVGALGSYTVSAVLRKATA